MPDETETQRPDIVPEGYTFEPMPEPADIFGDVLAFHKKFVPEQLRPLPAWPPYNTMRLRGKLFKEELEEFLKALDAADFVGIVDGSLDLVYVIVGGLYAMGVDPRPIWEEIQRTNMAKEGGGLRGDGKVMKPEGWTPPDIVGLLAKQKPMNV